MRRALLPALAACCIAQSPLAATHSAWSTPIAWDETSATRADAARPLAHAVLRAVPSPNTGSVQFTLPPVSGHAQRVLQVYTVAGDLVAAIPCGASGMATWRTDAGAGAYIARITANGTALTTEFVLSR